MPSTLTNDHLTPTEDIAAQRLLERAIDSAALVQGLLPHGSAIDPEDSAHDFTRSEVVIRFTVYGYVCDATELRLAIIEQLERTVRRLKEAKS